MTNDPKPTREGDQVITNRGGNVIQGSVSNSNVAAGNITQNFYQAPPAPTVDQLSTQAMAKMRLREYGQALALWDRVLETEPLDLDTNFRRTLCMFMGQRPRLASLDLIKKVERKLETLTQLDAAYAPAFALWALVKVDYFEMSGMYSEPPDTDLLVRRGARIGSAHAKEIVISIPATSNRVWEWLKTK
jgi:hypothetical protein